MKFNRNPERKQCVDCPQGVESWIYLRKRCRHHYEKDLVYRRKNFPKEKVQPKSPYKKESKPPRYIPKKKPTGELHLFAEIWEEREHVCFICGCQVPFAPITFSHTLGKGAYGLFRLNKENIELMCAEHHNDWDFKAKSDLSKKNVKFEELIIKAINLKRLYYNPNEDEIFNTEEQK